MTIHKNRNIKVEATTGEVYYDYSTDSDRKNISPELRTGSWLSKAINAHLERLVSLRVYDGKRAD